VTGSDPASLRLYRLLTGLSAPALEALLRRRLKRGKEDPARIKERRGEASLERPPGFLVWIHAVSVGEANSALPLIEALLAHRPALAVLLTTGTLSSAQLMAERLPASVLHQFAPLDHPRWVRRFLDHWRPDLGLIIESELWPNLILAAEAQECPLILMNARISAGTTARWLRFPGGIRRLLRAFTLCLAQDWDNAARLYALGAAHVEMQGNLKFAGKPLPDQPAPRAAFEAALGSRPCWLAASTHPGEEELIAEAHALLRRQRPDLVTLIAPRHPGRGDAIAASLAARGLTVARRAQNDGIGAGTEIYLADTLGELGLFYRLARIVFLGGTLVPIGGQNPLEPIRLGCAVIHGPHTGNFADIFLRLDQGAASERVETPQMLALAAGRLLDDDRLRRIRADAASRVAAEETDVLTRVLARLKPFLPRDEPGSLGTEAPADHARA
jgi:3-deoxy-D-manno-octulosonic-acid transferase